MRATMRIHDIVLSDALDGAPMGASTVALDLHNRWSNAEDEFLSAIMAVRLCGTSYVTEAADNLFSILQNMQASNHDEDKYEDAYQAALKEFPKALNAFLEAARHDLAYNPKWWQLPRRWRERQYRKGRASAEAPALSA
ncbi:hypothetical protein ADL12_20485 [Streptomyces regalis]|uniref:Uncharacterized protein n=1 Tax=Streptomyces regalis TaxID=68262 RepID=A0A0X3UQ82_9ACTN|nr:hypothetical protein ADL12_20485 [Streptomyces regalis]